MSLRGGGSKKDYAATAEAKRTKRFRCKDSFIDLQGREFLASGDWSRRVKEMFERDGGKCQWVIRAGMEDGVIMIYICGKNAYHPHHVKHKGQGGDDSLPNLMSVCWGHHIEAHPEKQVRLRSIPA